MPKKGKISNFETENFYIPQKKANSMYNKDSTKKSNISHKKSEFFSIVSIFNQGSRTPENF